MDSKKAKNLSGIPTRSKTKRRSATSEELKLGRTKLPEKMRDAGQGRRGMKHISGLSRTLVAKELKENLIPNKHELSSSGSILLVKNPVKSMSCVELKRMNQELLSEISALHERSEQSTHKHSDVIIQLTQEIKEQKEINEHLKTKIECCQARLRDKNNELDNLQQTLEGVKFENERLVQILEGARIDAGTGCKIEQSTEFVARQHKIEMDLENQNIELDDFISSLDLTISRLQVNKI